MLFSLFKRYLLPGLITDADMEDYGFEYSDEEPEEQDVDIENQYYNTKGICWHEATFSTTYYFTFRSFMLVWLTF